MKTVQELPLEVPDEEADKLASRIIAAEYAYDLFCRRREEAKLRELFCREMQT